MFDQLLGGVQRNLADPIGREEEEEVFKARNINPLLVYRCKLNANGSPQESLVERMRTIDILFDTIVILKPFSPMTIRFLAC